MKGKKYSIILFRDKKKITTKFRTIHPTLATEEWNFYKNQKPPRFLRLHDHRGKKYTYELALISPQDKRSKPIYTRDELGRTIEAKYYDSRYRIRDIIPFWAEETIYDYNTKKQIKYNKLLEILSEITDIAQIFKLNNKILLQIEDEFRMFGNKNLIDCERLFDLIREDIINAKKGNFIFVKDVNTVQRKLLYEMLVDKGFDKQTLYRHYSC